MRATLQALKSSSSNRWLARQAQDPFVRARAEGLGVPNLRARSGFKLAELAKKHRTLLHGRAVVDLGAAPGGWTQVAAAAVARRGGAVVAVDLLPMEEVKGAHIVTGDFLDETVWDEVRGYLLDMRRKKEPEKDGSEDGAVADTVLSDMMAAMSGVRDRDVQASLDLVSAATEFAHQVLRPARLDASDASDASSDGADAITRDTPTALSDKKSKGKNVEKPKGYPGGSLVLKFFLHPDLLAFRKEQLDPYFARVVTEKPKASRSESSEAYWVCLGYKGRPAE